MPAPENGSGSPCEHQVYPLSHPTGPLFIILLTITACPPLGLTPPELASGPSRASGAFRSLAPDRQSFLNPLLLQAPAQSLAVLSQALSLHQDIKTPRHLPAVPCHLSLHIKPLSPAQGQSRSQACWLSLGECWLPLGDCWLPLGWLS